MEVATGCCTGENKDKEDEDEAVAALVETVVEIAPTADVDTLVIAAEKPVRATEVEIVEGPAEDKMVDATIVAEVEARLDSASLAKPDVDASAAVDTAPLLEEDVTVVAAVRVGVDRASLT